MGCETSKPTREASISTRDAPRLPMLDDPAVRAYAEELAADEQNWLAADAECRAIGPRRDDERRNAEDSTRDESAKRRRVAFDDAREVTYIPCLDDYGKRLLRETFWESDEFDRMFKERRLLAIKNAKAKLAGKNSHDDNESRRGLGIDPWEEKLLGRRAVRNARKREERAKILAYQKTVSQSGENWDYVYEDVAAKAASPTSGAYRINHEAALAAARIAQKEHDELWARSDSYSNLLKFRRASEDHYATPARAKRRSMGRFGLFGPTRNRKTTSPSFDEISESLRDDSLRDAGRFAEIKSSTRHPGILKHYGRPRAASEGSERDDSSCGDDEFYHMIRADSLNNFDAASVPNTPTTNASGSFSSASD
mmetsp:Transcript_24241/g.72741  ORF Transcript_24241/g.72741 Transcript_24241/m.72741 type:complete len:368 (+) Transcript_24241:168-1271(+)